ncbi:MAG: hypothetical protein FWG66_03090, partial [Spirochaetes bacterium]|nr:hypothetical protein [Spirochaetota bacterium]
NLAEEEKMVVQALEKAEAIRIAEIDQGRFEGRLEGQLKVAISLLKDGFPPEMVKKHTGLPEGEIQALLANLTKI